MRGFPRLLRCFAPLPGRETQPLDRILFLAASSASSICSSTHAQNWVRSRSRSIATSLAKSMVTQWGMSDLLGPLQYGDNQEEVFLGHSVTRTQNVSEETARLIDGEVKRIVTTGHERARQLLTDHLDQLHTLAQALLEYETLSGDEIRRVLAGETIDRGGAAVLPTPTLSGVSAIPKTGRRGFGGEPAPQPGA